MAQAWVQNFSALVVVEVLMMPLVQEALVQFVLALVLDEDLMM